MPAASQKPSPNRTESPTNEGASKCCQYWPEGLPLPSRVEAVDLDEGEQIGRNIPADRLAEYLGAEQVNAPRKRRRGYFNLRTGQNWHNAKLAFEKFRKVRACAAYIATAKKRGWMGEPESDESLFAHACHAVFKTETPYKSATTVRDFRRRVFALSELLFLGQKATPPQEHKRRAKPCVQKVEKKTLSDAPSPAHPDNSGQSAAVSAPAAAVSESGSKAAGSVSQKAGETPRNFAAASAFVGLLRANAARFEAAHTGKRIAYRFGHLVGWAVPALQAGASLDGLAAAYAVAVRRWDALAAAAHAVRWEPSGMCRELAAQRAALPVLPLQRRFELRRAAQEKRNARADWAAILRRAAKGRAVTLAEEAARAAAAKERRDGMSAAERAAYAAKREGSTACAADLFAGLFAGLTPSA